MSELLLSIAFQGSLKVVLVGRSGQEMSRCVWREADGRFIPRQLVEVLGLESPENSLEGELDISIDTL